MTMTVGLVENSPQVCRLHLSFRITIPPRLDIAP